MTQTVFLGSLAERSPAVTKRRSSQWGMGMFKTVVFINLLLTTAFADSWHLALLFNPSVMQSDDPVRELGHFGIMGDQHDCPPLFVKLSENIEHDLFIRFIQVPGWFVGEYDRGFVDQRPRDADSLLLAS